MECQGSEVTAHRVTLPSAPWSEPVASRDGSRKQRMKNERCVEFWWDGGTGSVLTRSSQHALCRLITIGREVCGAFDYKSQQRPLGVLLVGWHHLHSSDPVPALMEKKNTRVVRIFPCTRGCSAGKIQMKRLSKPLQSGNFAATANAGSTSPRGSGGTRAGRSENRLKVSSIKPQLQRVEVILTS